MIGLGDVRLPVVGLALLKAGDHIGACKGLLKYTYSNGKYSRGLANRRQVEYKLCIRDLTS